MYQISNFMDNDDVKTIDSRSARLFLFPDQALILIRGCFYVHRNRRAICDQHGLCFNR